jgi:hypothetical protein
VQDQIVAGGHWLAFVDESESNRQADRDTYLLAAALVMIGPGGTTSGGGADGDGADGGRRSNNSGVACVCGCGRRIRVAPSVLELGPIACGVCGSEFEAPADSEAETTAAA